MQFLNTALVLTLGLCNIAGAAVLPTASPAITDLSSEAIAEHLEPSHGMCSVLVGISEKKPSSREDRESSVSVSLWDGQNKTFEGLTWDNGEPLTTRHSINDKPPGEALRIHGLFSHTDSFSVKWVNMNPGAHWEWLSFGYSGGAVGEVVFDDSFKGWISASCNRTDWVNAKNENYERTTRCSFLC